MANHVALQGRVAIVTGGSRGIGLATATALCSEGIDVLLCGRSSDALDRAVNRIKSKVESSAAGRVTSMVTDVRRPEQVQSLVESAVQQLGGLDILINNAGVGRFRPLSELTMEDWLETIETNLSGVFYCCRASIPVMRKGNGGWIVNVSSLAGKHPFAGGAAYCAAKAGLNALTESLMQEVRHDGIRVSCVLPGSVATEFAGNELSDGSWKLDAADVAQAIVDLLRHPKRSLPSRVEMRPSMPQK
jgi:NAD(P)-dependent dehydrogenase (short-subunit alcohol dehydrogenase family)